MMSGKCSNSKRSFLKIASGSALALCASGLGLRYLPAFANGSSHKIDPKPSRSSPTDEAHSMSPGRGLVRPSEAMFYTKEENKRVKCGLCPNTCSISPGGRGACRVRENRDGDLFTLAHSNPAMLQIDPIERNPFFHVLPSSRALALSTAGCNMACKFCQVWDTALVDPEEVYAYDFPPQRVVSQAKDNGVGSIAYSLGEPVIFYEYMLETAKLARKAGIKNLLHSNGYINPEPLAKLLPLLDAANIDLKSFDPDFYRRVCKGALESVKVSLKAIKEANIHIEITTIVIPSLNDNVEIITKMCRWIRDELGPDTPLHFVRFYPLHKLTNLPPTPVSTLNRCRAAAGDVGINYVYIGNAPGHSGENTVCPECKETIIERMGFMVENNRVSSGSCENCGRSIAGLWS